MRAPLLTMRAHLTLNRPVYVIGFNVTMITWAGSAQAPSKPQSFGQGRRYSVQQVLNPKSREWT